MSWLGDHCPRLARARAEHQRLQTARARRTVRKRQQLASLERLVAHRELQFLRAGQINRRGYVIARQRKLDAAKRSLAHIQNDLRHVNEWEPRAAR